MWSDFMQIFQRWRGCIFSYSGAETNKAYGREEVNFLSATSGRWFYLDQKTCLKSRDLLERAWSSLQPTSDGLQPASDSHRFNIFQSFSRLPGSLCGLLAGGNARDQQ